MKTFAFLAFWLSWPAILAVYCGLFRERGFSWPKRLGATLIIGVLTFVFYACSTLSPVDNLPQFLLADAYPIYTFPLGFLFTYLIGLAPSWFDVELGATTLAMTFAIAFSVFANNYFFLMIIERVFGRQTTEQGKGSPQKMEKIVP